LNTIRIIGIDPGIIITGFCIIDFYKSKMNLVAYGVIRPSKKDRLEKRLLHLHDEVSSIISKFHPTIMAMEDSFYSKNVKSAVTLGQARSAIMLSGAKSDIDIYEFAPRKVKQSVCGNGSATKEQVQFMVTQILNLDKPPKPIDITDAMAVGLCFVNNYQVI
jgi:crossover junction endodeoxyribonuclease RuvC